LEYDKKHRDIKNNLDSIPANLLTQNQLTYLDLSGSENENNKFSTLPEKLFQIQQLKYLNLSYCKIDSFTSELGKLSELTSLDLSGNQLTALPLEIEKLIKLTELNLNENNTLNITSVCNAFAKYSRKIKITTNWNKKKWIENFC
jgi:Leucine-rich repeat (LRR) protein